MRTARGVDGNRLIGFAEFLNAKQIAGFFSRLAHSRNTDTDLDEIPKNNIRLTFTQLTKVAQRNCPTAIQFSF